MSPAADFRLVRRVLLALDSSMPQAAALAEAARLARRLDAELTAIFIEDVNLLHVAELPLARHINLFSGGAEPVDMALMEARLRAQAARTRLAVEAAARQAGLRWSFRTVRGRIAEAVIAAAGDQDLLLIGWTARAIEQGQLARVRLRRRPSGQASSLIRRIAIAAGRPVLLLRDGDILNRPIAAVFDGSEGAARALDAAAALAAIARQKLVVLVAGDEGVAARAATLLAGSGLDAVEYRPLRVTTIPGICDARAEANAGVIVIDAENPLLAGGNGSPLAAFSCPVLLAR
jgi:hypothetical protein